MIISEKTMAILKNFSSFSPGIFLKEGNIIRAMNDAGTIFAQATIDETIPQDCGIYDLSMFLGYCGMTANGTALDITFNDNHFIIREETGLIRTKYYYSGEGLMKNESGAYDKTPKMPSEDIRFDLSSDTLGKLLKAASFSRQDFITVGKDADSVILGVIDEKDTTAPTFQIVTGGICEFDPDVKFNMMFNKANLQLFAGDYKASLSKRLISHFKHESEPVEYWIALDKNSTYEG